jgi:acyl-CoA synthetase (AMP-forming)/AMP-acid ligase II
MAVSFPPGPAPDAELDAGVIFAIDCGCSRPALSSWTATTTAPANLGELEMSQPVPHQPRLRPFDDTGVERDDAGILRYTDLAPSLVALFRAQVEAHPDREALVEIDGERLSYQEYWDRSARVAGGLRAAGVEPGDRVAIRMGNGIPWALAFWGIEMAGAVAVPVNTRFAEPEVEYVVTDSGAKIVLRDGEPLPDGEAHVEDGLALQDLAAIFYTSGTTGFPKGAMTSHENFLSNCETCRRVMDWPADIGADLRNLISVPMFHVTGCNSQLLATMAVGGTVVVMPTFEVQHFLRIVEEERISIITTVPAILWLAMNQPNFAEFDVSAVRWVTYGGAPTAPEAVGRMMKGFPGARLGNGFGLTETSSVSTFLPHEYCQERPETVGFAAPVVELALDDVDASSDVGELLIRGQNVVQGYWNKPEQTRDTFIDGWLHTGDLARIDDDGFVQIVDRKKDMVNRGGENVYCVEVENVLAQHPDVFEVAVIGVPDAMMGEKVGAIVVPRPGHELTADGLVEFARGRLADFKIPQYVHIAGDPLPRNPGGKVLKPQLRESTTWGDPLR